MKIIRAADTTFTELLATNRHRSCITAGQVLVDVLRSLGVQEAYPLTVQVRVFNPPAAEYYRRHGGLPTAEDIPQWKDAGCAIIKVGEHIDRPDNWPAHLVVVVPRYRDNRPLVVDLTIIQAFMPEWKVKLDPIAFLAEEGFLTASLDYPVPVNGCLLFYSAFPDDKSFEDTPIWREPERIREAVSRILAQLQS